MNLSVNVFQHLESFKPQIGNVGCKQSRRVRELEPEIKYAIEENSEDSTWHVLKQDYLSTRMEYCHWYTRRCDEEKIFSMHISRAVDTGFTNVYNFIV